MSKKIFTLLGLPASGKGTQAETLAGLYHLDNIGIGDLIRTAIENGPEDDPLVTEMKKNYDSGIPQPDHIVFPLLEEKLKNCKNGVVFDNFPFSHDQARFLQGYASKHSWDQPVIIYLNVDPETAIKRMMSRRICDNCGAVFIASQAQVCDQCGGKLIARADDNEETIRTRIDYYYPRIQEMVKLFSPTGRVLVIDGEPSIKQVAIAIEKQISELTKKLAA
ncbi:MAG: Adenylate kinase [bacterium ADurb.Bin400]|nr:MAG: Adenylate kinase [bacterium ADurb.Bin400]